MLIAINVKREIEEARENNYVVRSLRPTSTGQCPRDYVV
jgi:hypothetical protein